MSSDKGILTEDEKLQIFGTSSPAGNTQINSTNVKRTACETLYCSGEAYIYGCINTPLRACRGILLPDGDVLNPALYFQSAPTTGIYLNNGSIGFTVGGIHSTTISSSYIDVPNQITSAGNLILNPATGIIDCNGSTLINYTGSGGGGGGGGSSNPDRYEVISPVHLTTNDATPQTLYNIPTVLNAGYTLVSEITCVNSTDGQSTASFMISARAKNIGGTVTVTTPIELNSSRDAGLNGIAITYVTSSTNIAVKVTGIASNIIKWFGATIVTRQLF